MNQQQIDLLTKFDLRYFVKRVFYTLNPDTPLVWNWHMDLMCYELARTLPNDKGLNPRPEEGRVRRLIINVPPRTLKSETITVAFTCFVQGHYPHERFLCGSYGGGLSNDLHAKSLKVVQSEWYKKMFPEVKLTRETASVWETTQGGRREAVSVTGMTTGKGGNYLIADDPLNASDSGSETERKKANNWFDQSFYNRQNNQKVGVVIVVMQRLHEDDLTGHLIEKNKDLKEESKWRLVKVPAEYEEEVTFKYYNEEKTIAPEQLLEPNRLSQEVLDAFKVQLGSVGYAGQFLQEPAPKEGSIFQLDWMPRYEGLPPDEEIIRIIQSWDTAIKTGVRHDFSSCVTIIETKNACYLADVVNERLEYPELKRRIIQHANHWRANAVLIEDKSSGQSLIQDIKKETQLPVIAIVPKGNKVERGEAASPMMEAGKLWLPYRAPWLFEFEKQMLFFPNGKFDDMVDALTQYLNWVRTSMMATPRIRSL